jgi:hypothetical protein
MFKSNQGTAHPSNQTISAYTQNAFESSPSMARAGGRRSTDPGYSANAATTPANAGMKPKSNNMRPLIILGIFIVLVDIIAFFF